MTKRPRVVTAKLRIVIDADEVAAVVAPFGLLKHVQPLMTRLGVSEWRLDEVRQRPVRRRR